MKTLKRIAARCDVSLSFFIGACAVAVGTIILFALITLFMLIAEGKV